MKEPDDPLLRHLRVASGYVVLGLIVFSVVVRADVSMVATLAGALAVYLGLRRLRGNGD